MKFCPNCDIRLVKTSDNTVLSCPKCTYSEGDDTKPEKQSTEEEPQTDNVAEGLKKMGMEAEDLTELSDLLDEVLNRENNKEEDER